MFSSDSDAPLDDIFDLSEEASTLHLELEVSDRDMVAELSKYQRPEEQKHFALEAMRIGIQAIRMTAGQMDAQLIKQTSENLVGDLEQFLNTHAEKVNETMTTSLLEYLDPQNGKFSERIDRLIKKDGDLERTIRTELGEGSALNTTLDGFVGENSRLMQVLDPQRSESLLKTIESKVSDLLKEQQDQVVGQFSLDKEDSALNKFTKRITDDQGQLSKDLESQVLELTKELSLDNQSSSLTRLKSEIEATLRNHQIENTEFREKVTSTLERMETRKQEANRSTRHGIDFETQLNTSISTLYQGSGHIISATGNTVGKIRHCKKGDCVIELGEAHVAAGASIVIEAKKDQSYTLKKALEEIDIARKNRGAQIGLFVFSDHSRPEGLDPIQRYGNDVVVSWDAEDPETDLYLKVGLTLAEALAVRADQVLDETIDFEAIDKAINETTKQIAGYEDIKRLAATICNNGEKIQQKAESGRKAVVAQTELLKNELKVVQQVVAEQQFS